VIVNLTGGMPADEPDLPWSPAYPGPAPIRSLLAGVQPTANTDFTVELPWPLRIIFRWNFLRLYGTTEVAINPGMEPDFFTGRIYGYIDRHNSNTARTVTRLQAFFNLSTLFHIYRFAFMSGILYRIPLALFRYGLMKWGFMPLFQDDFLWRIFLNLVAVFLGIWFFDFWPLHFMDHVCRVSGRCLVAGSGHCLFWESEETHGPGLPAPSCRVGLKRRGMDYSISPHRASHPKPLDYVVSGRTRHKSLLPCHQAVRPPNARLPPV
jgi:hypothetical protein